MTATLMTVAAMDSRMMKRENDFCWLNAIRLAIKDEMFTIKSYSAGVGAKPLALDLRLLSVAWQMAGSKITPRVEKPYF